MRCVAWMQPLDSFALEEFRYGALSLQMLPASVRKHALSKTFLTVRAFVYGARGRLVAPRHCNQAHLCTKNQGHRSPPTAVFPANRRFIAGLQGGI